jgi:hypothetical protein
LGIFFLILGVANLVRAGTAAYVTPVFQEDAGWSLALPIEVLGGFYLFWGIAFIGVTVLTLFEQIDWGRRKHSGGRGAVRRALIAAFAYQGTLWMLRLLAYRSTYARSLWARDGLLTMLFLAAVAILGTCIKS